MILIVSGLFKLNGCKTALDGQKKDHSSIQLES